MCVIAGEKQARPCTFRKKRRTSTFKRQAGRTAAHRFGRQPFRTCHLVRVCFRRAALCCLNQRSEARSGDLRRKCEFREGRLGRCLGRFHRQMASCVVPKTPQTTSWCAELHQISTEKYTSPGLHPASFPLPSRFLPASFPLPSLSYHGLLRRIKWQERRKRLKTACSWFCFFLTVSAYVAFLSMLMVNLVMSVYYGLSDSRTRCISTLCVVVLLCCRERLRYGQRRPDANDQPRL